MFTINVLNGWNAGIFSPWISDSPPLKCSLTGSWNMIFTSLLIASKLWRLLWQICFRGYFSLKIRDKDHLVAHEWCVHQSDTLMSKWRRELSLIYCAVHLRWYMSQANGLWPCQTTKTKVKINCGMVLPRWIIYKNNSKKAIVISRACLFNCVKVFNVIFLFL